MAYGRLDLKVLVLLATLLAACGSGEVVVRNAGGSLVAISVTPANLTVADNSTYQFNATGIYSNNTTRDLTDQVTWEVSDANLASVTTSTFVASNAPYPNVTASPSVVSYPPSSKGLLSFSGTGAKMVKAKLNGNSGSAAVTVTAASLVSLAVTPADPQSPRGTSRQFNATGTYSDNSTQDLTNSVVWSTSNASVATISSAAGSMGLAFAAGPGSATIRAVLGGVAGASTFTVTAAALVSIEVTPANASLAKGTIRQFAATGIYSDNSTQDLTAAVSWSTGNTAVATAADAAGSKGQVTAVSTGATAVLAILGSISGSTALTVTPAELTSLAVVPVNPSIAQGTSRQFTATGGYSDSTTQNLTDTVAWYSSNTGIATISNAAGSKGSAIAVATGSTVITAASGSVSGTTLLAVTPATLVSIKVTPANSSLAKGTSRQFIATGTYTDNSTQDLTAIVTWGSSNTAITTISNAAGSKGAATALSTGSVTITAASGSMTGATTLTITAATLVSIAVTPGNPSISTGGSQQFSATGTYSDGSTQGLTTAATWSSSASGIAAISNAAGSQGLATGIAAGTTTIAAASGSVSGTTALTVIAAAQGSATLAWGAPTTYTDGTPVTNLGGFKIYYGTAAGTYATIKDIGNVTTYTLNSLASGNTYYFAVTAYDSTGAESDYSNEISKMIP